MDSNPSNDPAVHISDIRTFRQCRRRWDWSSGLRQNLEPIVPYAPFFTGKAIHAALEFFYRDGTPLSDTVDKYLATEEVSMMKLDLWPIEQGTFESQIELIRGLIDHYALWIAQDTKKYSDANLEYISLETEFTFPVERNGKTTHFGGRMDGLVKHKQTGELWVFETKTSRSVQELARALGNDEQSGLYMIAARRLGYDVRGVLYNIIRKKVPTTPQTLQDGRLSGAKSVDTTAFHYLWCIKQEFPDWEDDTIMDVYGNILAYLLDNEQKYFMRLPIYRSEVELEALMENLLDTADEMLDPNIKTYPAPNWLSCNFCLFKSACLTKNAGGNYQDLLDAEFQSRSNTSMRLNLVEED